jgi:hypothetical protein
MKTDEAVAPVIAAMLVLAVIVTFFAVWNATAIPSMKAQSEVTHLHEVEEGMLRFSSDIDTAASMPASMKLSERIPLGGGDILYSATKSGGSLIVQREEPYMKIEITVKDSPSPKNKTFYLSNISYQPTGNFWQDQGYVWSYGYVNVTKGQDSVPLEYPTMQDVKYDLAKVLFNMNVDAYDNDHHNCSIINIKGVEILPSDAVNSVSGNGIGTLNLNSTVKNSGTPFYNVTEIQINTFVSTVSDQTFNQTMYDAVNASITNSNVMSCPNIQKEAYPSAGLIILKMGISPVTVIRQTTTILIDTQ